MTLNEWAAAKKTAIFERLKAGKPPDEGSFDEALFRQGLVKGAPQMGITKYEPQAARFEFIFPDPASSATILLVTVAAPKRIVFLPVPNWVIEDIWQGGISGSYQFEDDAKALLDEFEKQLNPDANEKWFSPQPAKRRE